MYLSSLPRAFRSCGILLFPALFHLLILLIIGPRVVQAYKLHYVCWSHPTSDILDTLHGSFVITGWNFTQKKLLLNGLDFPLLLLCLDVSPNILLICFPCGALYELFHYASNTILGPYPSLLAELKRLEDRIGDQTGRCLVVWVFCPGCFPPCASWRFQ